MDRPLPLFKSSATLLQFLYNASPAPSHSTRLQLSACRALPARAPAVQTLHLSKALCFWACVSLLTQGPLHGAPDAGSQCRHGLTQRF